MKVIHIQSIFPSDFESLINKAIEGKKVIDIKYSSVSMIGGFAEYSALIMCEEEKE